MGHPTIPWLSLVPVLPVFTIYCVAKYEMDADTNIWKCVRRRKPFIIEPRFSARVFHISTKIMSIIIARILNMIMLFCRLTVVDVFVFQSAFQFLFVFKFVFEFIFVFVFKFDFDLKA